MLAGDRATELERPGEDRVEAAWTRCISSSSAGRGPVGCRLPSPTWPNVPIWSPCAGRPPGCTRPSRPAASRDRGVLENGGRLQAREGRQRGAARLERLALPPPGLGDPHRRRALRLARCAMRCVSSITAGMTVLSEDQQGAGRRVEADVRVVLDRVDADLVEELERDGDDAGGQHPRHGAAASARSGK